MSLPLIAKRILVFSAFALLNYILGIVLFSVPLSAWLWYGRDTAGGGQVGFLIALVIVAAPFVAVPGALIAGLLVLPIVDGALKAATRSGRHYVAFLIAMIISAFTSVAVTYATAGVYVLIMYNTPVPNV